MTESTSIALLGLSRTEDGRIIFRILNEKGERETLDLTAVIEEVVFRDDNVDMLKARIG